VRAGAFTVIAGMALAACGGTSGGQSQNLASDQTLKFPMFGDYGTLDPAQLDAEVDSEIAQNIFNGPWRFDNNLNIVPDIATEVPTEANKGISADGLTYTIHLRKDVTFSNGDKVTAKDLLYSWNRAAALQGSYSSNLGAIDGFGAVAKASKALGKPSSKAGSDVKAAFQKAVETKLAAKDPSVLLKGLTAPDGDDGYTVQVKLSAPAGWFLSAVTLESTTGMLVDQKVVATNPRDWWTKPETLIGTGAFKETAYTPKQSADFESVANWWGTPKPTLKKIHVDIKDPSTESTSIAAWEQNSYDIVGYGGYSSLPTTDILRIKQGKKSSELTLQPKVRTTWVTFNVNPTYAAKGPFVGTTANAKNLRKAFALSIDKKKLASTVCHDLLCTAADSGIITKGLKGNTGPGSDDLANFDATEAKNLLKQADPTGSLTKGLKYSFNAGGLNDPVATFLQDQWKTNLGVDVALDPHPDATAFIQDRQSGKFVISRDGWQADYDHPQDWFDNLWGKQVLDANANSSGYDSTTYDENLAKADALPLEQALPVYKKISQELSDNVIYIPLYYSQGVFLIHPYVKGAGSNNFFDRWWNEIQILQH